MTAPTPEPTPASSASTPGPASPSGSGTGGATPVRRPVAPATTVPRTRGSPGGGAVVVAVCALLLAFGATVVAVYALDVAREAKSQAAMAASGDLPATPTTRPAASPTPPTTTATGSPTSAALVFLPVRLRAEVAIPAPQGCVSAFVDVDTMVVGVDAGHEFYLTRCQGPLVFRMDRTGGAVSLATGATPQECVEQIATSSTGAELVLVARPGLTFCLLTAEDGRPSTPQLVGLVDVRAVDEDDSVSVMISTYRMPG